MTFDVTSQSYTFQEPPPNKNLVNWGQIMTTVYITWSMFEPTPTWHNVTFGQLFVWIWIQNYKIWLFRASRLENRLQPYLIKRLVNWNVMYWGGGGGGLAVRHTLLSSLSCNSFACKWVGTVCRRISADSFTGADVNTMTKCNTKWDCCWLGIYVKITWRQYIPLKM